MVGVLSLGFNRFDSFYGGFFVVLRLLRERVWVDLLERFYGRE